MQVGESVSKVPRADGWWHPQHMPPEGRSLGKDQSAGSQCMLGPLWGCEQSHAVARSEQGWRPLRGGWKEKVRPGESQQQWWPWSHWGQTHSLHLLACASTKFVGWVGHKIPLLQGRKLKGSLMGWFEERVSYSLKVTELKRANGVGAEGGMWESIIIWRACLILLKTLRAMPVTVAVLLSLGRVCIPRW